ncbi:MAG: Mg2+ and Co2+ transporter CorA [Candidatus Deianiraeaceae bacterium]|jgi:Mg2+ and Co2+ transporter CorA
MSSQVKNQFDNIKKLIDLNIESIGQLISQADGLEKIINDTESSLQAQVKKQLQDVRNNIVKSINGLMEHTNDLFKSYDDLIDTLSSKL